MSIARIAAAPCVNARAAQDNSTHNINTASGISNWGPSVSFTKNADDSLLLTFIRNSGWHTVATGTGQFYLGIDGTDYLVGGRKYDIANDHQTQSSAWPIAGIDAGTHTIQLKAATPTSGNLQTDANDTQSFMVMEVASQNPGGALPLLRGIVAHATMGSVNVTSTSYVNTTLNKSFTKLYEDTRLIVMMVAGGFNVGIVPTFAIQIDGTDTQICKRWTNTGGQHKTLAGVNEVTGVGAGTYTATMRVKVAAGTWSYNGGDDFSFMILEVP